MFPAFHDTSGKAAQEPWGQEIEFTVAANEAVMKPPGWSLRFPCPRQSYTFLTEIRISAITGKGTSSAQIIALRLELIDGSDPDRSKKDVVIFSDLEAGARAIMKLREELGHCGRLPVVKWSDERW